MVRRNPGVVYGLSNILDNAVDFAESRVDRRGALDAATRSIEIRDDGPGYAPDVLLRVGEPYVTTRSAAERDRDSEEGGRARARALHRQDPARALGRAADPVATRPRRRRARWRGSFGRATRLKGVRQCRRSRAPDAPLTDETNSSYIRL